jgi:hypothetical protein
VEELLKCPSCLKIEVTKNLVTHIGFLILGLVFLLPGIWCIGVAILFWDPKFGSYFVLGWGGFFSLTGLSSLSKFINYKTSKVKQLKYKCNACKFEWLQREHESTGTPIKL